MIRALLALLLTLVACGDPEAPEPQYYTNLGIGIVVEEGAAEWAYAPDLGERVDAIAVALSRYVGKKDHALSCSVIAFGREPAPCPGHDELDLGCAFVHEHWASVATLGIGGIEWVIPCVEQSALGHEMLHLLGFWNHDGDIWDRYKLDVMAPLTAQHADCVFVWPVTSSHDL